MTAGRRERQLLVADGDADDAVGHAGTLCGVRARAHAQRDPRRARDAVAGIVGQQGEAPAGQPVEHRLEVATAVGERVDADARRRWQQGAFDDARGLERA